MEDKKTIAKWPSVKELFVQTWEALVKSVLNLFLLSLAAISVSAFLVLLGIGLIFALGLGQKIISLFSDPTSLSLAGSSPIMAVILIILVLLLVLAFISLAAKAASILIVARYQEENFNLGTAIRQGFKLVIPLWVTSLLVGLLTLGGFFILILPGLFLAFLFMFSQYEVVLEGKKFFQAAKASMQIAMQNFGAIIGRISLYVLFYFFVMILIPGLISKIDQPAIDAFMSLASFFLNILVGWFGLCYMVVLYQQARKNTDFEKKAGFGWVVAVALLGWVIVAGLGYLGIKALPNLKLPLEQMPLEENMRPTYPGAFEDFNSPEDELL